VRGIKNMIKEIQGDVLKELVEVLDD